MWLKLNYGDIVWHSYNIMACRGPAYFPKTLSLMDRAFPYLAVLAHGDQFLVNDDGPCGRAESDRDCLGLHFASIKYIIESIGFSQIPLKWSRKMF